MRQQTQVATVGYDAGDNVVMHDVRPYRGGVDYVLNQNPNFVTHYVQTFVPTSTNKRVPTSLAPKPLCPSCLSRVACKAMEDKGCHLLNVSILSDVCESPGFTHWPLSPIPGVLRWCVEMCWDLADLF